MSIRNHKTLIGVCFLLGFLLVAGLRSRSAEKKPEVPQPAEAPARGLLIDLGNETCPVMGGAVNGKDYFEWSHLRIGVCCPGCDRDFLEDPEGSLETTSTDWRAALTAVESYRAAPPGAQRTRQLEEIRGRWTVLRLPEGDQG